MVREDRLHSMMGINEALCAYIIAKNNGKPHSKSDYREAAGLVNEIWHDGEKVIESKHIRSLMRHCYDNKLNMLDFLPDNLERYFRKYYK